MHDYKLNKQADLSNYLNFRQHINSTSTSELCCLTISSLFYISKTSRLDTKNQHSFPENIRKEEQLILSSLRPFLFYVKMYEIKGYNTRSMLLLFFKNIYL